MLIEPKDLLLEGRLTPITTSMGFFEGECTDVVRHFIDWQEEIKKSGSIIKRIATRCVTGNLENILRSLLPLQKVGATKYLFIPAKHGWTAYFDNGYRGTDPTVIGHMPELMPNRSVWVVARRHKEGLPSLSPGALVMEVFGNEERESHNLIRSIRLTNNFGKWEFQQSGEPFPFEQTERYQAKRVTNRFDFSMLKDYLKEFRLSPFHMDFYLPVSSNKAVLVDIKEKGLSRGKLDVSLETARQLNGID